MKPGENKTVQSRILAYAQEVGWTIVSLEEAERRRASSPEGYAGTGGNSSLDHIRSLSLFFDDLLDANPPFPKGFGEIWVREIPRFGRRIA